MSLLNLKIQVDTHTHSVLSGHAWSTIIENVQYAKKRNIKKICVTEHAPAMPGTAVNFFVQMMRVFPESIDGVDLVKGLEFNIMDFDGNLDVTKHHQLKHVDWGIASMHDVCLNPGTIEQNTSAMVEALKNPYVDIAGHPGNPYYTCDALSIVMAAKANDKMIEINNNSFGSREGCKDNCIKFAQLCKKHDVRVCVSSDSHIATSIGVIDKCLEMLNEIDFPKELILNRDANDFEEYLQQKKSRLC